MMGNEVDYSDAFDAGADWQLQRCIEIVDRVILLKKQVRPDDSKTLNTLRAIISMMETGE